MKNTAFYILFLTLILVGGVSAQAAEAVATPSVAARGIDPAPSAELEQTSTTSDDAWEKFAAARRVFQIRLSDLANRRWPEYKEYFKAYRDLQLAYIERRKMVFYHLRKNEPARIVRDKGGESFLNFAWTPEEETGFLKSLPGYKGLSDEIERLQDETSKFKNENALRERFERLEIDPEYLALMRETTRSILEAEQVLVGINPLPRVEQKAGKS